MAKGKRKKDKQYNGQGKRQKNKQYNGQRKTTKVFLGHYIVCPFFVFLWPLDCLSFGRFLLTIILFVLLSFSFGHYIACPYVIYFCLYIVCRFVISLWPLYCLSFCRFPLVITLFEHYNGQRIN
jgi:hypothetical protein